MMNSHRDCDEAKMESVRNTGRAPAGPRVPSKRQVESPVMSIPASTGEEVPLSEFNEAVRLS